jgi:hypothetical protein
MSLDHDRLHDVHEAGVAGRHRAEVLPNHPSQQSLEALAAARRRRQDGTS